jgi:hypothetical protein
MRPDLTAERAEEGDEAHAILGGVPVADGAGHHHDRHVSAVVERANPRDQLHAVHALESITHEHRIVVDLAPERFTRPLAVGVPNHLPIAACKEGGEHLGHTVVALHDQDRLHEGSSTRPENRSVAHALRAFSGGSAR